jgi:hypothetical protein
VRGTNYCYGTPSLAGSRRIKQDLSPESERTFALLVKKKKKKKRFAFLLVNSWHVKSHIVITLCIQRLKHLYSVLAYEQMWDEKAYEQTNDESVA